MATAHEKPTGPDLTLGIALSELADGAILTGHVGDESVLVVRRGEKLFAIGAACTHYGAPLGDGFLDGETIRCPWHHACFSLRTGEALGAPAFNSVPCWNVELQGTKLIVREKVGPTSAVKKSVRTIAEPERIVIVGGGAAGFAAAEMLRRDGFDGNVTMFTSEETPPCDRPNLSKDYLAGNAPEDWIPLRPPEFYNEARINLELSTEVVAIEPKTQRVVLADARLIAFDKLLIATGAEPVRMSVPGAEQSHVHVLRSLSDSRAIIAGAKNARRAVVIGASFIGLEAAASLRARKLEVHVVAPETVPMARVLGPELGAAIRSLHEQHGVVFHLEDTVAMIEKERVLLQSGKTLDADLVITGIGVKPRIELPERAGLKIDRGVAVDAYLRTSAPNIFAAGDIACWPDPQRGERIRMEHWVVAQRQGQIAAKNMLGAELRFTDVPFFWSQHYDVPINYVGHAENWDEIDVEGDIRAHNCLIRYRRNGRVLAMASINRSLESFKTEAQWKDAVTG